MAGAAAEKEPGATHAAVTTKPEGLVARPELYVIIN